jgi:hypothetical protein
MESDIGKLKRATTKKTGESGLRELHLSFSLLIFLILNLQRTVESASCPNSCSGHGSCIAGTCSCYDNWGLGNSHEDGDCSDRICPFGRSWVDFPDANGTHHKYLECSGKGICDRKKGECNCFDGFEGKSCRRTTCPGDCSGHGRCQFIESLGYGNVEFDYNHDQFTQALHLFDYYGWDKGKSRACVCDPGYTEYDCSKRLCPQGNDVMVYRSDSDNDVVIKYQTQLLHLITGLSDVSTLSDLDGETFALTFKTRLNESFTTQPIVFDSSDLSTMEFHISRALKHLPNGVITDVDVSVSKFGSTDQGLLIVIQFSGVATEGPQFLLTLEDQFCGDGCTPKLSGIDVRKGNVTTVVESDYGNYECGRRGRCDYATGICQCFDGYTGPSCSTVTSLR